MLARLLCLLSLHDLHPISRAHPTHINWMACARGGCRFARKWHDYGGGPGSCWGPPALLPPPDPSPMDYQALSEEKS